MRSIFCFLVIKAQKHRHIHSFIQVQSIDWALENNRISIGISALDVHGNLSYIHLSCFTVVSNAFKTPLGEVMSAWPGLVKSIHFSDCPKLTQLQCRIYISQTSMTARIVIDRTLNWTLTCLLGQHKLLRVWQRSKQHCDSW